MLNTDHSRVADMFDTPKYSLGGGDYQESIWGGNLH